MTNEEIDKYVDMGDIEKDEEITTERAIAEVYRWIRVVEHESYEYKNLTPKVLNTVMEALEQTKWIPVSEKLPNFNDVILASVNDDSGLRVIIIIYSGEEFWFNGRITAWMPLPKPHPYKESEEYE